ncbi:hypothetical protein KP509_24G071700 [Ceratopteris richardii]|uniref:Uncharacterized protein n=3 Tax=Ceratopteris richardii TaxID=49495 RepID=A0A8T2RYS5_CERRI|nr:hypothetical protein KP509_24G071700 [Ceratopteris richardii]
MGTLTLDLRPGAGLGPFLLGMPVCDAFAYIDQHPDTFDAVQVKYHDEEPLLCDLVVSFPNHGFHLRFEPRSQRLRLIEVFEVQLLQMRYATSSIGGANIAATFVAVYALFGPTFPGTYDMERCIYTLFYPGLSFAFPIPPQHAVSCQGREAELPLEFPDGTTPVMSRVCVYDSSIGGCGVGVGVGSSLKKAVLPPLPAGSLYLEEIHVKLGIELSFATGGQTLTFGLSPQDVWTELGRPCGIQKKQVDPMVIHSASGSKQRTTICGDYFYNYFTRGIDILFDGQTNRIKKFVLHTNFPGHTDFNSYIKCNFIIDCRPSDEHIKSKYSIRPETKWNQVKEFLGDGGRAAIQTQGSVSNPFGPTFVYSYRDIALEVMKNGHIATVTLFQSTP